MRKLIIFSAVALALSACTDSVPSPPANQPDHPMLDNLKPPPLNSPIRLSEVKHDTVRPQLAAGDQPTLMILQDDALFSGQMTARGTFIIAAEQIEFQPDEATPLQVLFRMPREMGTLIEARGTGRLQLLERSGPEGADRVVVLSREDAVVFGEIWQRSAEPLNVALNGRWHLMQTETGAAEKPGSYTPVDLALYDGEESIAVLPIGELTEIPTSNGDLMVFVETSHLFDPEQETTDQYPREYILHVWLAAAHR